MCLCLTAGVWRKLLDTFNQARLVMWPSSFLQVDAEMSWLQCRLCLITSTLSLPDEITGFGRMRRVFVETCVKLTMNSEAMIPSTMAQKKDAMTPILMKMMAAVSLERWRRMERKRGGSHERWEINISHHIRGKTRYKIICVWYLEMKKHQSKSINPQIRVNVESIIIIDLKTIYLKKIFSLD